MERIISQIHKLLIKKEKKLAVAESCTGGLVSELLTRIPGSSSFFILGVVVYSNEAKTGILNVPEQTILKKGAVSKEVASFMAKAARLIAKADYGLGITGIAGPSNGSKEKPVGTVFIAIDAKDNKICRKFHFKGSRLTIRKKAALKSLALLRLLLGK